MTIQTTLWIVGVGMGMIVLGTLIWCAVYIRAYYAIRRADAQDGRERRSEFDTRLEAFKAAFIPDQPAYVRRGIPVLILGGIAVILAGIGLTIAFVEPV